MDIKLLSGALGAEISGINLKDSSDKNFKIINKEPVIIVLLDSYGKYTRIADAKRIRKWMEKNINQSRASTQFKNIIMQPS